MKYVLVLNNLIMDLRETEEFKRKQQEKLKRLAAEEISFRNIISNLRRLEELRHEVYAEAEIGAQGIMRGLVFAASIFSVYTYTNKFSLHYPKAAEFFGRSMIPRAVLIFLFARIGIALEQYNVEHNLNPVAYKNYISAYNYTESLKEKRLKSLDMWKRIELVTGFSVPGLISKIKQSS